ncbi:hypothetical protein ABS784_14470 [Geobacillus sp. G4]
MNFLIKKASFIMEKREVGQGLPRLSCRKENTGLYFAGLSLHPTPQLDRHKAGAASESPAFAPRSSGAILLRKRNDSGCLNGKNTTHSVYLLFFCNKTLLFCNGRFGTVDDGDVFF